MRYEVIETLNGWIVRPGENGQDEYDAGASKSFVFVDANEMAKWFSNRGSGIVGGTTPASDNASLCPDKCDCSLSKTLEANEAPK
ncbi:MAG: hypothetical protein V4568_14615 [Pseudomonadota bacterium]